MRIVLIAIVCAILGSGIGYWRYRDATVALVENFGIPAPAPMVVGADSPASSPAENDASVAKVEVVGGTNYDFGSMQKGTSRNHKFVFRNVGGIPAELEVKSTSCKCTIGSFGNGKDEKVRRLLPGEETEVEMTWTAESVLRDFGQSATVLVTPSNQEIQLVVKGYIVDSLEFEPSAIDLGNISSKETISRQIKLFSNFSKPLEILDYKWNDKNTADRVKLGVVVKKREGDDPDHIDAAYVAIIDMEILPGMPTGNLTGGVVVTTNINSDTFQSEGGTGKIVLSVSVQGKVVSDVRFIGGSSYNDVSNVLTVGDIDSAEGKIFKISLVVKLLDDEEVQFKEIVVRPPKLLDVRVGEPIGNRNKQLIFPITMEIPKGAGPVDFGGSNSQDYIKITFRTNLPHAPEIPLFLRLKIK